MASPVILCSHANFLEGRMEFQQESQWKKAASPFFSQGPLGVLHLSFQIWGCGFFLFLGVLFGLSLHISGMFLCLRLTGLLHDELYRIVSASGLLFFSSSRATCGVTGSWNTFAGVPSKAGCGEGGRDTLALCNSPVESLLNCELIGWSLVVGWLQFINLSVNLWPIAPFINRNRTKLSSDPFPTLSQFSAQTRILKINHS